MHEHNLYVNNVYELMAIKPSILVADAPIKLRPPARGEIRFESVTFVYPGAEANAITDVYPGAEANAITDLAHWAPSKQTGSHELGEG
jgi:ABC-type multidrug transport system fused ATPase/permease subunit